MFKDITNIKVNKINVTVHKIKHKQTLYKWMYDVSVDFNYHHITLLTAILMVEKYTDRFGFLLENYQLIGITALYVAAKIEETNTQKISVYEKVTDYTYTKIEILKCERKLLDFLDYDLSKCLGSLLLSKVNTEININKICTNIIESCSKYRITDRLIDKVINKYL